MKLRDEFTSFEDTGISLLEHSHRDIDGPVQSCMVNACDLLRDILSIPETHDVLLMHGGAHAMFSGVPMNLAGEFGAKAYFIGDGYWSKRASSEADKYCTTIHVADATVDVDPNAAFVHITANETISGVEHHIDPSLLDGSPPLVADFTSTLLSRPVDFSKYGVVYASTGKNLGPSGLVVVICRKSLLGGDRELKITPGVMSWAIASKTSPIANIWNTPNVFGIRALQLVLEDCKAKGGVEAMRIRAKRRARLIYEVIDASDGFYVNTVDPDLRSLMTIPITIGNQKMEKIFLDASRSEGFYNLKGHPLFGGIRVTLYNQIPDESVFALVEFMKKFERAFAFVDADELELPDMGDLHT
jgi:phosphoserine aminotransferase